MSTKCAVSVKGFKKEVENKKKELNKALFEGLMETKPIDGKVKVTKDLLAQIQSRITEIQVINFGRGSKK